MKEHSRTDTLHRTRARSRLYLGSGFVLFAGALLAIWLLRPGVVPYTPGTQAAGDDEITSRLARGVPAAAPHVAFTDAAAETGLRFTHFHGSRSTQLPEDMGSGAAWGDYDGDGDPDLYLVNISGPLTDGEEAIARSPARSALFRNDGGRFTDVTDASGTGVRGTGMAAAWGDYDGDGDLDLFVTRYGTNVLLRNDGDGHFTDVTAEAGLGGREGFWAGASWGDYDRDGDVDLYVCGYVRYAYDEADAAKSSSQYNAVVPYTLNPSTYSPERNLLYRNDGGHFTEVAREAGVENAEGRSLSAAWADLDGDGWPDLYVANDISDNVMYRNLGNGRFEDVSHSAWVADYRGAMGLAVGDRDNDGDLDIFVSHWIAQENALYDNLLDRMPASKEAPMHFIDDADLLGLGQIALDYIGWGTGFFDYDNDGRLDLFVANGSTFQREKDPSRLVPMKNLLFWNAGAQEGFYEVGSVSGPAFAKENVGRGAAIADFDLDGDLDVAVVDHGGAARLLRNGGSDGHWARILLRGPDGAAGAGTPSTSTFALGARVRLDAGG
ncbi:MAG TPA: VCBS repeat-containing protein, partial [Candidatus Saccharimonadales bacterium]|nr:VCBS repeat-containing protein [Candidatus Saccharimonadales bacterium]